MSAGQRNRNGAKTEFEDDKAGENDKLSKRQEAQRKTGQGLDGKGAEVDEHKESPADHRPAKVDRASADAAAGGEDLPEPATKRDAPEPTDASEHVDRPGFDLGGSTGGTHAGKGLGLGSDARKDRKGWRLPR